MIVLRKCEAQSPPPYFTSSSGPSSEFISPEQLQYTQIDTINEMSSTKLQQHHHHHPHHRHAPFIHDLGLMNWLIGIWLGIVIAGFMLDKGIHFVRDHSLFPSFSSSFAPITSDDTWIHLESHGDVELMYRTIVPTLGLHAHRAVVVADLPIESLLHVFRDTPNDVRIFRYHEICT